MQKAIVDHEHINTYRIASCMHNKITSNKNIKLSSFKSSKNIQKKEGGPDGTVSNNQYIHKSLTTYMYLHYWRGALILNEHYRFGIFCFHMKSYWVLTIALLQPQNCVKKASVGSNVLGI